VLSSPPILAVFASGQGTNFEALVQSERAGELGGTIRLLMCDRPGAPVLERAKSFGIEALTPPVGRFRTRIEDEAPWLAALMSRGVEIVLLAGFMRRLHSTLLAPFRDRILNVHPSLLPAFPGLDAIGQAWRHGALATGCTVHLVDALVDAGPILAQASTGLREEDTIESLAWRIHAAEHRLYPRTVFRYLTEPWRREGARVLWGEGDGYRAVASQRSAVPGAVR
jgi:phosphoribosylglycinamide formyltransferase-1